ncbi:cysteine--tRNA ligase [Candidatus Roizmanbacteria bacterium]|nr:MAG: cysteine--tRNA ligase [Candidatus Roizmanbacteria bacterium]
MKLYDTLSRDKQQLPPPSEKPVITMYSCGPTVYDDTHIGHMRRYVMDDVLKRTLQYFGHEVRHVMNITDVGHLTGDDDSGEDKLEKGAIKRGKTVWDVAQEYEEQFWHTMAALNVFKKDIEVLHATQNIEEMVSIIKKLEEKGYTYETDEALYFDVTKFADYGKLSGQKLDEKKQAVREEVYVDKGKRNPADFALWFKRVGRFADHTMHWESPWGDGFPGWHIECSAMSMKGLDTETIDIHTGGIDHIPVHHENEIAQSEAATGKPFVKWWVHHAFLQVDGEKMSKSKGNFYTLKDIEAHEIDPLSLRLFFMQAHYRKPMNFTWEAAQASYSSFTELHQIYNDLEESVGENRVDNRDNLSGGALFFLEQFEGNIGNDLNVTTALGNLWYMLRSNAVPNPDKFYLLQIADEILGLNLDQPVTTVVEIPDEIRKLADERLKAREEKDFQKSDDLRTQIEEAGYQIEDSAEGYQIKKK